MSAKLIYHVAVTLDGRIAHPDGSYDGFLESGPHVDAFMEAVSGYAAVLMGRKTYEVGLDAGLTLGQPAYPGRPNYVFSGTLPRPETRSSEFHLVNTEPCGFVAELKQRSEGNIWLCGGAQLAGSLMEAGLLDELILKMNPTVFGDGLPLAAGLTRRHDARWLDTHTYETGAVVARYALLPS